MPLRMRPGLIWCGVAAAGLIPFIAATQSELLQWREPVYIAAGLAGVAAMVLMLLQPLLAGGYLPGIAPAQGRRAHRLMGILLLLCVGGHILGLWITSPPDVIDTLLFRSPAPFAAWGTISMWAVIVAAGLAAMRGAKRLPLRVWRRLHTTSVAVAVASGALHAILIEGTMEPISKWALCLLVVMLTGKTIYDRGVWRGALRTNS